MPPYTVGFIWRDDGPCPCPIRYMGLRREATLAPKRRFLKRYGFWPAAETARVPRRTSGFLTCKATKVPMATYIDQLVARIWFYVGPACPTRQHRYVDLAIRICCTPSSNSGPQAWGRYQTERRDWGTCKAPPVKSLRPAMEAMELLVLPTMCLITLRSPEHSQPTMRCLLQYLWLPGYRYLLLRVQ